MSAPTQFVMMVLLTTLVVLTSAYTLVKYLWNWPLRNGPGFFQGVEVPAGFYEGPGRAWLKSYRAALVALHLLLAVSLGIVFALRCLDLMPLCIGGWAIPYLITLMGLDAWTRHKLGANPPVRPVALALESRRLGDYISWPQESLMFALVAFCWWLEIHLASHKEWQNMLMMTWIALGLLPAKILLVRSSHPLPVERTEEHYRYQDAMRRSSVSVWNSVAWLFVLFLVNVALRDTWTPARTVPGLRWLFLSIPLLFWFYIMFQIFRGMRLTETMGRDLLPPGSWSTPFRGAPWIGMVGACGMWGNRPYMIWFAVWFGGILAFIFYPYFR